MCLFPDETCINQHEEFQFLCMFENELVVIITDYDSLPILHHCHSCQSSVNIEKFTKVSLVRLISGHRV